jgi:D-alanine transaminase|tara:strand:+ start:1616 stop:2473 length:858 start_codon:yes stop_codon:yes gene_type:complete
MSIVFLNHVYLPAEEAKISPMDRGFLFGDSIYEVLPSYNGQMIGFNLHINRLNKNMSAIDIGLKWSHGRWMEVCEALLEKNGLGNLGIYLQVSRGSVPVRSHAYTKNIDPTIFAFSFEIAPEQLASKSKVTPYKVTTNLDLRWARCQIKSTALLGNVMHFQNGYQKGFNETLLYNGRNELTEGSTCNAYIVKDGVIATPPLDNHVLPGVTRHILLDLLRKNNSMQIEERVILMDEVFSADEVWVTSSSKEIVPVVEIDGKIIGNGKVGDIWLAAQKIYSIGKRDY